MMNIEELYRIYEANPSVQTDTRRLKNGDLFFALKGPNFNGNHYAKQALESGASFCIVDEDPGFDDERLIEVKDVLKTLQDLARFHRLQFSIPFLAITGSNGKTTTKELIHTVLATTFKTYTTEGNLNNHIGIPLTILKIKKDAEMAVIEMGANHQKEIEGYCVYALPTHGLITNCGKAHLEGFGGVEGVRKGKGELYAFLKKSNGTIFMYKDYDYLQAMSIGAEKIITYASASNDAEVIGHVADDKSFLSVSIDKGAQTGIISTQLVGGYNLPNVLAAVCVGKSFCVSDDNIKKALENYVPSNSRSQLIRKDSNNIILDAYNANPSSMKLAIENFAAMEGENKILMIGGMMELGDDTEKEHLAILNLIQNHKWMEVVLVGEQFKNIHGNHHFFMTSIEARDWFEGKRFRDANILIKGSRSMQMEKVIE